MNLLNKISILILIIFSITAQAAIQCPAGNVVKNVYLNDYEPTGSQTYDVGMTYFTNLNDTRPWLVYISPVTATSTQLAIELGNQLLKTIHNPTTINAFEFNDEGETFMVCSYRTSDPRAIVYAGTLA